MREHADHITIMHIAEAAGGVERYLVTLLRKMQQYSEFEHILVCSSTFDTLKFRDITQSIRVIESMHNAISPREDKKAMAAVRKAMREYRPDIIYCHSSKAGAIGRIAKTGVCRKLIYNPHGWAFNMRGAGKKAKLYEKIEKMLAGKADRIICISEYEKESALEHKICNGGKLQVINNGIDFDEFKNLRPKTREELGIPRDAYVIGTVGRITKQKAPDVFVRMAAEVKKQIPEAFFLMVGDDIGDGKCRNDTEKQIREAGLQDCFCITGWVDQPMNYAAVFDVATLLSRWEGFGLVLPEYMILGKPFVATKTDAIPYVTGDAGLMVETEDAIGAAKQIIRIRKDPELERMLVMKGIERVGEFNAQRTAEEHRDLFMNLIQRR